jgi:DNA transposition AAA+ family ATPase
MGTDLRQELRALMEERGISQGVVARALGISNTSLSQWLSSTYKGNVSKIDGDVEGFLRLQNERSKGRKKEIAFVQTSAARKLYEVARICHLDGEIGVVYGEAGIGKTMAAKQYAAVNTDVILIEADLGYTARALFTDLHRRVGLDGAGTVHDMFNDVVARLDGSGRMIIIDEAEHLPYRALELLRRIYDKAGIGILLVGMPRLVHNLRGKKGEYAQLYSRVGIATNLQRLQAQDAEAIVRSVIPESNGLWKTFMEASGGNSRRMSMLIIRSIRLAEINDTKVTPEVVQLAAQMLIV